MTPMTSIEWIIVTLIFLSGPIVGLVYARKNRLCIMHRWSTYSIKREPADWEGYYEKCVVCGERRIIHYSGCPMDPPYVTKVPRKEVTNDTP